MAPKQAQESIKHHERAGKKHGKEIPILIHSDLKVVGRNLEVINDSFIKYQGIRHINHMTLRYLISQNFVTGCSTLINRAMLKVALPVPDTVIMHDWCLALCAAACGRIEFMEEPTLLYRQHGNNEVGAKNLFALYNPFGKEFADIWKNGKKHFLMTFDQARALEQKLKQVDSTIKVNGIRLEVNMHHVQLIILVND